MKANKVRLASALSLCERLSDAAVGSHFTELGKSQVFVLSGSLTDPLGTLHLCHGVSPRRNQKRPGVWLIRGDLQSFRSAGKAPAFFPVGPLEQNIQKEVACKDAKPQK